MIYFLWNLLLAIFWSTITGEFNVRNLLFGFILGYLVLWTVSSALNIENYFYKTKRLILFIYLIMTELLKSSFKIAFDIVTPQHHMRPGIIKIPLDSKTSEEITMFSNLVSLTPGTLSLDVSEDRKFLYVHVMYIHDEDLDKVRNQIKRNFEGRVLELLR